MHTQKKYIVIGILAVIILIIGVTVVRPWLQKREALTRSEVVSRPALNIAFTFPNGQPEYTYIEPIMGTNTLASAPEAAFILMETEAYRQYEQAKGGETPKSITLFVFPEPEVSTTTAGTSTPDRMTRIRDWAMMNNSLTSFSQAKSAPEDILIDGTKAIHYQTDGLYQQDIYIAFHRNRFYLFVGQYDGETDTTYSTFKTLMNSVTFL